MLVSNITYFSIIAVVVLGGVVYFFRTKTKTVSSNGATPFLNSFTTDFTALARSGRIDPVVGRDDEVRKLTQILSRRSKNNAILVGAPGVGKTAIVEGLAQRIARNEVPETLQNKRVLALDITSLMAGTKYRGEFEDRTKKILRDISASNRSIILFIDEVHSVVQSQGSEGSLNLSDILKPALARGDLQMIGATTHKEYEKYIQSEPSLERRFQLVEIREASPEEALIILQGVKDKYREYHKVEFTDAALATAVNLAATMVEDRKLPDKAIDALDEAGAMVKVAHIHPAVSAILYQVAVQRYPEVTELWKNIQELDKKISAAGVESKPENLVDERERLEKEIAAKGVVVVDSGDVEKIIHEWAK